MSKNEDFSKPITGGIDNSNTVSIKGELVVLEKENGYSLTLKTPAADFILATGSYMHCTDLQQEISN